MGLLGISVATVRVVAVRLRLILHARQNPLWPSFVSDNRPCRPPNRNPEHAERMFDAFFTTKPNGIGLGLSICRSIVESHGGRLSVFPAHPHGSVFQVMLPAATNVRDPT